MVSTQLFLATPKGNSDVNCFYAHHLMPDDTIEQLGFSESFMHCCNLDSDKHTFSGYQENETPISPECYQELKSTILDFLSTIDLLFDSPVLPWKTDVLIGNTYIYNNRIGKILHIKGERAFLGGIQKNKPLESSAFLASHKLEEFDSDTVRMIDPTIYETFETKREVTLQKLLSLLPPK